MNKLYRNKLIGTSVFVLMLTGIILAGFSFAEAKFISNKSTINIDGVVAGVSTNTLTILTSGSSAITFEVDNKTKFSFGLDLNDLEVGDQVNVLGKISTSAYPAAKLVKKWGMGPGYGTTGDNVTVSNAVVAGKTIDTLTVDNGIILITFQILAATDFVGKSWAELENGDTVNVFGEDAGTGFVARMVVGKK